MFVTSDVFASHLQSFADLQTLVSSLQSRISTLEADRLPPPRKLSVITDTPPGLRSRTLSSIGPPPPPPPLRDASATHASHDSISMTSYSSRPSLSSARPSLSISPSSPPHQPLDDSKLPLSNYDAYIPQLKGESSATNYNAYTPNRPSAPSTAASNYDAYVPATGTGKDGEPCGMQSYDAYVPNPKSDNSVQGSYGSNYELYNHLGNVQIDNADTLDEVSPYESDEQRHEMAMAALQPARETLLKELEEGNKLVATTNKNTTTTIATNKSNTSWFERFLYAMNHTNSEMLEFSRDFHREVTKRARLILEEMNVPIHKKTIPPLSAGGVAGGTKYLDNGILFKFANDPKVGTGHLYGGAEADPERAAKAAANDLKGANAYLTVWQEAKMPMIILPQIVMDFIGFRLIAMPWVEMKDSVIVSGSGDGGTTVVDEDEVTRAAFKYAASELHLAFHYVRGVGLYAAGDIEVHKAKDGKRFVLDLARTFPPEDPEVVSHLPYVHSSIFFRLHRANFLQHLKQKNQTLYPPLNPDALSGWGHHRAMFHNKHVKVATEYLMTTRMNDLVKFLLGKTTTTTATTATTTSATSPTAAAAEKKVNGGKAPMPWTRLGALIQSWGISIRHLGLIRNVCAKQRPDSASLFQSTSVNTEQLNSALHLELQLVVCMVARSGKNLLRQEMREAAVSKNVQHAIITFLNTLVRTKTVQHDAFWSVKLPHDIIGRFGRSALFTSEENRLSELCKPYLPSIVFYICSTSGILLSPNLDMREITRGSFEFSVSMIQDLSVRSKTLDIFEELLLTDLIEKACKAKTATDFFTHVMHLSQKRLASPALQAALDFINPPFAKIEPMEVSDHVRLQCLTLQCLALHFKGHTEVVRANVYGGMERLDPDAIALLRSLPQIFVKQQELLSDALVIVCSKIQHETSTPALVASLIEGQADVNTIDTRTGDSLLHSCALRDHFTTVELLLKAKADIATKDKYNRTFFSMLHPQDLGYFRAIYSAATASSSSPVHNTIPTSPTHGGMNKSPSSLGSVSGAGSVITTPLGKHKAPNTFTLTRLHGSLGGSSRTTLLRADAARNIISPGFRLRIHMITGQIKRLQNCFLQIGMRRATDASDKESKTSFINLNECTINNENESMYVGFETFFEEWPEGHSLMMYIHQASVPNKLGNTLILSKKPAAQQLVARLSTGRPVNHFEVIHTTMASKDSQNSGLTIYLDVREVTFNPPSSGMTS